LLSTTTKERMEDGGVRFEKGLGLSQAKPMERSDIGHGND
jgi:hypothetical protein